MDRTPPDPSEALAKARANARELAGYFVEVFGQDKKRTTAQKRVIAHLKICAGDDGNAYRFNEAKDGVALVAAGIHRDGAQSILRVVERQLAIAAQPEPIAPKAAKPVSKR